MADLNLYCGEDQLLPDGFGLGFFGQDGFGAPVRVGQYNGRTFVTNASGSTERFECNNIKKISTTGLIYGQAGSGILLTELPDHLSTMNIRFTNEASVRTLSAKLYIFDGTSTGGEPNKDNPPPGIEAHCAEIRHTGVIQSDEGLGDSTWQLIAGSGAVLGLIGSPGTSGIRPNGMWTVDTRHDWYIAMSCTPKQLGDKKFGMYFECEFV